MKKLLKSPAAASVGAIVLLFVPDAFGNTRETRNPIYRTRTVGQKAFRQNVFLEEEKTPATTKLNVDSQGIILKGFDVVAYFKEGKPVKGNSTITSSYGGATYLFASTANKAEFDKNPDKYAPKYGGFCAYGVTVGVLSDPEGPSAFIIYKGKLYICGNQGALKDFKNGIDGNIGKAEKNWPQLATP
jgi:YHS domain-containing protein